MEGGDGQARGIGAGNEHADAMAHFLGRLVGEGGGKDLPRRNAVLADEPGDPVSNDACFPRAGAGNDQERPIGRGYGFALLGIEGLEQWNQINH